jgi:membrane protease YdiL (CAAX protease family)
MSSTDSSALIADEPSGIRALARRYPVTLYLTLVFGLGYPLMFLPLLAQRGVIPGASLPAMVGLDTERAAALLLVVFALLPAAVIVTGLEGGRPALAALVRRMTRWRVGAGWWAFALLALPAVAVVLALILGDTFRAPTGSTLAGELGGLLVGFLLINLWEETAWAGFMQTRLERQHNLYLAAALTAVPFAAIHLPLQVINGVTSPVDLAVAFLLLATLAIVVRSFFGLVLRATGNSLLLVGLAHTVFNRSNNTDGIAAKLLDGGHRQVAALLATLMLTIVLGVLLRRRATRAERARLDALNGEGDASTAASPALSVW